MTKWRFSISTIACIAIYLGASTLALSQTACTFYSAREGDTLSQIASTAKTPGGYQLLYSANAKTISAVGTLRQGDEIRIPCADGALPVKGTEITATAISARTIRLLTAGNYAPFTDESARAGGMFTELVRGALRAGDPSAAFEVVFVNDWGAHLTELLPHGAFDLGFPWFLPDCTRLDRLSPLNQIRCTEYDASDPFFEAVVGYYANANSPYRRARYPRELAGARICRPDGWFTFDLEVNGLTAPSVTLMRPATQHDCWRLLQDDKVDIVTIETLAAEEDIAALHMNSDVSEIVALATVETLHVFSHKSRPDGPGDLQALNAGLKMLRDSGQWYEIVANQMREHMARKSVSN